MTHLLPPLPYALDGLEPSISAETLSLHHDKHHRAYVDKLNAALKLYPQYQHLSVEALLQQLGTLDPAVRDAVRKQGGGHANHSLLWRTLAPQGQRPSATLLQSIEKSFPSFDALEQALRKAADQVFGSGWVFLAYREGESLFEVLALPNQDSPLSVGATPLLALDLWEHAYYLQYRNERIHWIDAWLQIVDWHAVEDNLFSARGTRAA